MENYSLRVMVSGDEPYTKEHYTIRLLLFHCPLLGTTNIFRACISCSQDFVRADVVERRCGPIVHQRFLAGLHAGR